MAMDMFIDIAGVPGESKDSVYAKKIDVLAWSWGMSQSGTFHAGGGGGAGKANVQDISFTKWLDDASAPLMLATLNGKHLKDATLIVRKAGETPQDYLKILMTDVMVTSVSTGGSGGEDRLTENVTLNFAKVKVDYFVQNEKGAVVAGTKLNFDIEANKAS
jgi:type VI secretion system secreted protein Hcp